MPFFVPMVIGVLVGVICYQIFTKLQQVFAAKRQSPLAHARMNATRFQARNLYARQDELLRIGEDDDFTAIPA